MPRRRLLVITYYYPPNRSIGGQRWASMARYLREAGHEVHVLTSAMNGSLPDDAAQFVHRTKDLQALDGLRTALGRAPMSAADAGKGGAPTSDKPAPTWMAHGVVPDANVLTWAPFAARAARRLVRELQFDCVVTSAPPDSVALIPLTLGKRRPAWIADFRDGWRFEPLRGEWPTSPQARLDARLERLVTRTAEVVIGATEPIADDFSRRRGANAHYVPNGWDRQSPDSLASADPVPLDPASFNLVYTGQLSGPGGRDPRPFIEAVERFASRRAAGQRPIKLIVVGGLDRRDLDLIQGPVGTGLVETVGQVPRPVALATQRAADALVLLTTPGHVSHATGKLFEYLAANRPILALAAGSAAGRIVESTGTGVAVRSDDVSAICQALSQLTDSAASPFSPDAGELSRYLYPAPAIAVESLVAEAISRRPANR